ncbi:hypothetical protein I317_06012 [Kwoniella heveanensis CBS 569]|uniref:NADP-dependent mannitol dehydrogenase n=1 Tax=Kwoniella heveanensis BCC8398 TaxID=1296120 RepID=A0A1B9GQV3_9TREE|nr:hypothetical protein I316_04831 [Kwoniella heveanensis BCC8398]OCF40187.1 hypothetical protein I317_06012 [Kwoniella heveanensis CBS 569]
MPVNFDFSGSTVIVTGGNRGIGFAISETLAKAGANVAIIYHSAKDAEEVAAKLSKEHNAKVQAWKCDVGNVELVKSTFAEINEKFGQVTGVVANAGVSVVKDALEMKKEDFSFVYDVNVWGQFACAQAAADLWVKTGYKKGSIVLTSSMSSQIVNKGIHQVFYNSSKAAASSIVKQLAVEWAEHGIRINGLCPGYVATDQTSHMDPKLLEWQKKELVPLGRFSTPEEQSYMTLLLLDPVMGG